MRLCNATVKLKYPRSTKSFIDLVNSFDGPEQLLEAHFITLTSGLLNGLRHGALNAENALICGKIIDSQTLVVEPEVNSFHFVIHVMCLDDSPGLNLDSLIEAVSNNPDRFVLAHNDCFNYINHFALIQSALENNGDYKSKNTVDLWVQCLKEKFDVDDSERIKRVFELLHSLTPGLLCESLSVLSKVSDLASIEVTYNDETQNYLLEIKIDSVSQIDSELKNIKYDRLKSIPQKLKSLQSILATSIKHNLSTSKVSQDIVHLMDHCSLIPHYLFVNKKAVRNRFSKLEAIEFLESINHDKNSSIHSYDIKAKSYETLKVSEIDTLISSRLLLTTDKKLVYVAIDSL